MQAQLFSSVNELHYTPADIIERTRYVFGGTIDLDPASDAKANATVKATRYYADRYADIPTHADPRCHSVNGLVQSWASSALWLNPPFTVDARDASGAIIVNENGKPKRERVIERWVARWIRATTPINAPPIFTGVPIDPREAIPAEATQAMLLVPARTDTEWFNGLWDSRYTLAFITGRLKFGTATAGAPFPSILVYYGSNTERFYDIFDDIAVCGKLLRK
jgi:hypothetical protein